MTSSATIVAAAPSTAVNRPTLDPGPPGVLCFADLQLDPRTRQVYRAERRIELTPTEFRLLVLFLDNPQVVLNRSLIFMNVWGFDFGPMSNLLHVYVGYLRRKIESPGEARLIHTVRGIGYVLREPYG